MTAILPRCEKITAQTGRAWRYLKVPQKHFDGYGGETFAGLAEHILDGGDAILFK